MPHAPLSRAGASVAVEQLGWRYVLGRLMATVPVRSLAEAVEVAGAIVSTCGPEADQHLRLSHRADRVDLELQTPGSGVTQRDVDLAQSASEAVEALGLPTVPTVPAGPGRSVQRLEVAIDALDIASIRPFWRAVLAYTHEPGYDGPEDALVDPTGEGPAVWFQQMDAPRPQRNRIHLDVSVPHDEADRRVQAALAAGGTLLSDAHARAFWVLADAEGNEACISTWQDRD
jgi:4a-hydroxytetrahydrobiopterin dehydratase